MHSYSPFFVGFAKQIPFLTALEKLGIKI